MSIIDALSGLLGVVTPQRSHAPGTTKSAPDPTWPQAASTFRIGASQSFFQQQTQIHQAPFAQMQQLAQQTRNMQQPIYPGTNVLTMSTMRERHKIDAVKTHEIVKGYECDFCPLCGEKLA